MNQILNQKRNIFKKMCVTFLAFLLLVAAHFALSQNFDKENAAQWLEQNSREKSKTWCAYYVMRAMQEGGLPAILLPAWAYKYYLPYLGFVEVSSENYKPEIGDIYVFQRAGTSPWGHIAMYTEHGWMSDFKQKGIYVSKNYINQTPTYWRHK